MVRLRAEKVGGAPPCKSAMQDFNNCIDTCALRELFLHGHHFTWTNNSFGSTQVDCVLDRALVNDLFLHTQLNF